MQPNYGYYEALTSDSSNLIPLLLRAINSITSTISLETQTDTYNQVLNITNIDGGAPLYTNVSAGGRVKFWVTLFESDPVVNNSIVLRSPRFGVVYLDIVNALPCEDCAGHANGLNGWDMCDVCVNLTSSSANQCLGCDGIPYSVSSQAPLFSVRGFV